MQKAPAPPAVPEEPWTHQGEVKRRSVQSIFDEIAPSYDLLNRLISLNFDRSWRRKAVSLLALRPGDCAVDLCCGTGDFFPHIRKKIQHGLLIGIDFSAPMLDRAAPKDQEARRILGDATAIPLASASAQAVTVGWGIRNVPDMDLAHREIFRILKPSGQFVSVDMAVPQNPLIARISTWVFRTVVPRLGGLLSNTTAYRYLPESTQRFYSREQLKASMEAAGFTKVQYINKFFGNICIHFGQKP